MLNYILKTIGIGACILFTMNGIAAKREVQFDNDTVYVWKTTIYPGHTQKLVMHRHDHDRVVVALTDGTLKVVNDKGNAHLLKLKKDHAYFLSKDIPNEKHTDENIGKEVVKVLVVEFKK